MAARQTQSDVLSRVRREQQKHGKPSAFSGLRIVFTATAITLGILLFAFGAIGMLLLARSPQEPIVSKLDPAPPVVTQTETPQPAPSVVMQTEAPPSAPALVLNEPVNIPAPEPAAPPTQSQLEKEAALPPQPLPPEAPAEPETTSAIPEPPAQPEAAQVPPRNTVRRATPPRQRHVVRRTVQRKNESQSSNPLFQLFGVRQYR